MNLMNAFRFICATVLFSFGISASAYDFAVDGVYYDVVSLDDMTCRVTCEEGGYTGELVIPYKVTYKNRVFTVKEIDYESFRYYCKDVTKLIIEDGIEDLLVVNSSYSSDGAFYGCPLTTAYLGRNTISYGYGASLVCNVRTLGEVIIGNSVTSIESYQFSGCDCLASVTIGNSVREIGSCAFSDCKSLTTLVIPNSVTTIESNAFADCI